MAESFKMKSSCWLAILLVTVLHNSDATLAADQPTKTGHRILACDKGKAANVNARGEVEWEYNKIGGCHDIWMLPGGNILLPLNRTTIAEVTPAKKIVWRYEAKPKPGYRGRVEVH